MFLLKLTLASKLVAVAVCKERAWDDDGCCRAFFPMHDLPFGAEKVIFTLAGGYNETSKSGK